MIRNLLLGLTAAAALVAPAHAWWNDGWSQRARVVLDTTDKGMTLPAPLTDVVVPVRLHSGNFDFTQVQPNGADLRVVGPDDKTPLPFELERFDAVNELAVLWVRLPVLAQGSDKNLIHVYAGNAKAPAEARSPVFANGHTAVLHFSETQGPVVDAVAGVQSATEPVREPNGLLAGALRMDGIPLELTLAAAQKPAAGSALTLALWIKADVAAEPATLLAWGPLQLRRNADKLELALDGQSLAGGSLPPMAWAHVALTVGAGKATLFVNGQPAGELAANLPELGELLRLGENYRGLIDEVQLLPAARDAVWMQLVAAAQGADARLVRAHRETAAEAEAAEGGEPGYFGVLVKNLTVDAWVVIVILMVMFAIACWVMVDKAVMVRRIGRANDDFLERFRADLSGQALTQAQGLEGSSLYRLYRAGQAEVDKRQARGVMTLSGAALDSIKATMDAVQVRENHALNARMVLLTIAISGGPFLGLLGTVVGVMITFAAIAAAGDVNVNAIAPGIAAALLATVAGLGVAIPALFGYNWLAAQIKNISADMQIFVDEFVTRTAENHGQN